TMTNRGVTINEGERCVAVKRADDGDYFILQTEKRGELKPSTFTARRVVLALGNRGAPMKLRVPGEEIKLSGNHPPDKVMYRWSDPGDFKKGKVLVVGGGNSAAEAAVDLVARRQQAQITYRAHEEMNEVTLVVRSG